MTSEPAAALPAVIEVEGLRTQFGPKVIHEDLSFQVRRGEIIAIVGGSGSGKSVLLKAIIGLIRPAAGHIHVLGQEIARAGDAGRKTIQRRCGVLFQDGALFSSLTVAENVEVPLREHTGLSAHLRRDLAMAKVLLTGLPADAATKYPSELSGGMRKRAGLARALALDPDILFLDEPTAGLDPIAAAHFDSLIGGLRRALGLTVVMVTHDLDSLFAICDRIAVLVDRRIRTGTINEMVRDEQPWIHEYFWGPRGRAAQTALGRAAKDQPEHDGPDRGA
jgi:phospholipid/cholesterol/gamma-HCH transport system ATP-binding protein